MSVQCLRITQGKRFGASVALELWLGPWNLSDSDQAGSFWSWLWKLILFFILQFLAGIYFIIFLLFSSCGSSIGSSVQVELDQSNGSDNETGNITVEESASKPTSPSLIEASNQSVSNSSGWWRLRSWPEVDAWAVDKWIQVVWTCERALNPMFWSLVFDFDSPDTLTDSLE